MKWREHKRASGLVEHICEHGVGHPDAASVEEMERRTGQASWGVHGCDGCCGRDDFPGKPEKDCDCRRHAIPDYSSTVQRFVCTKCGKRLEP